LYLWCAVLCCAVLCCAVLCCAVALRLPCRKAATAGAACTWQLEGAAPHLVKRPANCPRPALCVRRKGAPSASLECTLRWALAGTGRAQQPRRPRPPPAAPAPQQQQVSPAPPGRACAQATRPGGLPACAPRGCAGPLRGTHTPPHPPRSPLPPPPPLCPSRRAVLERSHRQHRGPEGAVRAAASLLLIPARAYFQRPGWRAARGATWHAGRDAAVAGARRGRARGRGRAQGLHPGALLQPAPQPAWDCRRAIRGVLHVPAAPRGVTGCGLRKRCRAWLAPTGLREPCCR
jgi:hypothetical protein